MLRGFWKLTWVETKVFLREPMGVIGTLFIPVVVFVVLGRLFARPSPASEPPLPFNAAIAAALFIAIGAVMSLITIIAIYREGGILKRLRATPLSPVTILGAHVVVKLVFTIIGLALLLAAGRRVFPGVLSVNVVSFAAATLLGTASILTVGFVIASLVPTARFAQPLAAVIVYPMIALSGVFFPVERFPRGVQTVAQLLPMTHAVALMQGVWDGEGWGAHLGDVAALVIFAAFCVALSVRVFRWE